MIAIAKKEIAGFFSSLTGYVSIGVFLVLLGLIMWVFPEYSLLNYNYASLDQLFTIAPMVFMFLVPAITMRSFAEERQLGTLQWLNTKPISEWSIVMGKFLACLILLLMAILPTLVYFYSVYQLGSPRGNIDSGQILGSYIGLYLLGSCFVAIGLWASSLTKNQIVSFLLACFLCFFFYYAFQFLSQLPVFFGKTDDIVQSIGIDHHYTSISRGVLDSRDVIYFISVIAVFLILTFKSLYDRK